MDHRRIEDNKSSTIARYWWRPPVLPPHTGGRSTRSLSLGRINGSTSTTQANTRSSSIRESRVKKVLVDGGSSINVTFPRTLQGLGVHLKELHESDTPFFGIVPTEGEYPLGHIYMPVTFGTPDNYRTEF
jgi:hypothetical protein